MFKKAGIVVAAAAAGLLAVSPLAFAGDYEGDSGHHGHSHGSDDGDNGDHGDDSGASCHQDNRAKDDSDGRHKQAGLINVQDTTVQVPIQACNNSVIEGVLGILAKDQKNSDSHG